YFFFSSRRRHTRSYGDWSSDVCSSDLNQNSINFGMAWELDFWGRYRRAIEAASADLDGSVDNYDDVLVTLLADVASNYVQFRVRSEEHTSELQSPYDLVCRLLLEKKKQ